MKAQDLRIGNLVNYKIVDKLDERKEWFEPCEIDAVDLQVIDLDYQPIPLTEKWLLKFGFFVSDLLIQKKGFKLGNPTKGVYIFNLYNSKGNVCKTIILEYVHSLQNLYFALTNEELTK
jgi:hypothetical protein